MAAGQIQPVGGNPALAAREVVKTLTKVPAVPGGAAQQTPGLDIACSTKPWWSIPTDAEPSHRPHAGQELGGMA